MFFSKWRFKRRKMEDPLLEEKMQIVRELRQAHQEWTIAQHKIDYALEKEQIDYAIYSLETAEKRYEMLLKQAKRLQIHILELSSSRL